MKQGDVPQDDSFLEGHRKAAYAVDAEGHYVIVPSRGYEAERVATGVALEAQDRLVQSAWERVRKGEQSPLAYHFAVRQWTTGLAAAQMGIARWRVWWHLKPRGFSSLSASMRQRYCEGLAVTEAQLMVVPEVPERLMDLPS